MNSKEQIVAAVDIGTTKIVSIVGKKTENGKIEILGLSKAPSNGVKRGVVINIDETVRSIQTTVRDVQQRTGIGFSEAFVGIAGLHITSMKNRGYIMRDSFDNEIREEEVARLKNDMYKINIAPGQQIIHVIPQSFIVDEETGISNPVGMCGKRLEANFHIVIGQIASAQNIGRCMGRANLKVKNLMLEPLASAEAVLTDDEREAGVVLVDIGGGTTDVAVYYDNVIRHTAVIPLGGNVVTSDIKEGCAILQRQAEQLKIQYGSAFGDIAPDDKVVSIPGIGNRDPKEISFKNLAYIIQSRMEEIIECVNFEIQNSGYADKLAAGVVVTGGGAMLKHLPQLMKFKTAMDVRIGLPNEHLSGSGRTEINQPMYSTAVGLIMCGIDLLESTGERSGISSFNSKKTGELRENPAEGEIETEEVEKEPKKEKKTIIDKFMDKLVDMFDADEGPSITGEN
ncbi:MAG TPA: cell division protein FtsA [Bacteroidetes bacterium]|nr:cell division protein FtsA [Bacteroidota bacterium]